MSVLVVSGPADFHAVSVVWALDRLGVQAACWIPAPPAHSSGTVLLADSAENCLFSVDGRVISGICVESVWMRRWPAPAFPADFDESDRMECGNQLVALYRGMLDILSTDILWANPPAAADAAGHKLIQLAQARKAGLAIPKTLATDDAAKARDFVCSLGQGKAIYKPFFPTRWQRNGESFGNPTTVVGKGDLDHPDQLKWAPAIFQNLIPKAFELRVSVFGQTLLAAKLSNQDPVDWRIKATHLRVEPFALPETVAERVLALMARLGLVMGMIDMIVTPAGDYVFLEVNEQGQFLWVEQMCPEIPMLDTCARFLASGDPCFRHGDRSVGIRCADFLASPNSAQFQMAGTAQ